MERLFIVVGIMTCSFLTGCASGVPSTPVDYENLPGSGDRMAKGPGIFKVGDDGDYDDGVRVFSNDPSKNALINTGNADAPAQAATPVPASTANATPATAPTASQQQEFEEYEQYRRFQQMPKNSPEYQNFKDWQEYRQYQEWRRSGR